MNAKPLHELWRQDYRERRYARHLSRPELNKRFADIVLNLLVLTPNAKIGLPPIAGETGIWMQRLTHALEEMVLRYGPYPAGFGRDMTEASPIPKLASELARKAAGRLSGLSLEAGNTFIKYGRRGHMEKLFEEGSLRIQPASFFYSVESNGAIHDDELTIPFSLVLSRDEVTRLVKNPQDVPERIPDQRIDLKFTYPRDYWIYCVTTSVQARLFVDFDAEACVIIHDKVEFSKRLREAATANFGQVAFREGPTDYVDPLLPNRANVFVPLTKYFGYWYQSEYRFCWLPKTQGNLTYQDIRLGPLSDIASLVVL